MSVGTDGHLARTDKHGLHDSSRETALVAANSMLGESFEVPRFIRTHTFEHVVSASRHCLAVPGGPGDTGPPNTVPRVFPSPLKHASRRTVLGAASSDRLVGIPALPFALIQSDANRTEHGGSAVNRRDPGDTLLLVTADRNPAAVPSPGSSSSLAEQRAGDAYKATSSMSKQSFQFARPCRRFGPCVVSSSTCS
jgi:hypothetical protein